MTVANAVNARHALEEIGYYRLSAYWYPFRESGNYTDLASKKVHTAVYDNFRSDADFDLIMDLYVFDRAMRVLVMDALERLEVSFRTRISLVMGKYNPCAHRMKKYLHRKFAGRVKPNGMTKHQEWLKIIHDKFSKSKEEFAKHFKEKYPLSDLPIWISVELWDFGTLSHFFAGLEYKDRTTIASYYGIGDPDILESWLRCINDIRNLCAHHSRLWNRPLVSQPIWPKAGAIPRLDHAASTHSLTRLYAALCIIRFLLTKINPTSTWHDRLKHQVSALPTNARFDEHSAGFTTAWQNEPLWS